jgi:hypothetical protein
MRRSAVSFFGILEDWPENSARKSTGDNQMFLMSLISSLMHEFAAARGGATRFRPEGAVHERGRVPSCARIILTVKLLRAHGGCLGIRRRRRTWLPAISLGETETVLDPGISEWDNPFRVMPENCILNP